MAAEGEHINYSIVCVNRIGSTDSYPILLMYNVIGIDIAGERIYTFHPIRYPNSAFPQSVYDKLDQPLPGIPTSKINVRYGEHERIHKTYMHAMNRCIVRHDGSMVIPVVCLTGGYHCLGKEYWNAHESSYATYRYIPRPSAPGVSVHVKMFPKGIVSAEIGPVQRSEATTGAPGQESVHALQQESATVPQRIINAYIEHAVMKGENCSITMEPLIKELCVVTPCWHVFHTSGLMPWIAQTHRCPTCHSACQNEKIMKFVA